MATAREPASPRRCRTAGGVLTASGMGLPRTTSGLAVTDDGALGSEVERGQLGDPRRRPLDGVAPTVPVERLTPARGPAAGLHDPVGVAESSHTPTASPARNAAPSVVASATGDTSTGRPVASARAWTNVGLALIPPSMRSASIGQPGVGVGRLDQVGAALGDALEDGPHEVGLVVPRVTPSSVPRAP